MAEIIAWTLYLIGFASVVINGTTEVPKTGRPWTETIAVLMAALCWPLGALILNAAKAFGRRRG